MPSRSSLLIVAPRLVATFTAQDREVLARDFDVDLYAFPGIGGLGELNRRVAQCDAVLIWFAGRHSPAAAWLARRHRKPVVTVVGGFEVEWFPSIGYGVPPGSLRQRVLRWVLNHSDRIVAVSQVTRNSVLRVAPHLRDRLHLIHNAVNTERFVPPPSSVRSGVLCVGSINKRTIKVKGWEHFCSIAHAAPDVQFTAIGPYDDFARRSLVATATPNVTWRGAVYDDDLITAYQTSSVYLQCSFHESFSLALAEAMSCGCIPVTTRGGALPEVAGSAGFFIDTGDIPAAAQTLREALNADPQQRDLSRRQMIDNFAVDKRREKLVGLLRDVLG